MPSHTSHTGRSSPTSLVSPAKKPSHSSRSSNTSQPNISRVSVRSCLTVTLTSYTDTRTLVRLQTRIPRLPRPTRAIRPPKHTREHWLSRLESITITTRQSRLPRTIRLPRLN